MCLKRERKLWIYESRKLSTWLELNLRSTLLRLRIFCGVCAWILWRIWKKLRSPGGGFDFFLRGSRIKRWIKSERRAMTPCCRSGPRRLCRSLVARWNLSTMNLLYAVALAALPSSMVNRRWVEIVKTESDRWKVNACFHHTNVHVDLNNKRHWRILAECIQCM